MSRPVALITGGARGIGRALVRTFAAQYDVAYTWHHTGPEAVQAETPAARAFQTDLLDPDQCAALPQQVVAAFGRLDVIINNAGQVQGDSVTDFDPTRAAEIFALNASAPMALAAAALPHLGRGTCIINITSTNARLPALAAHSYSASKAALETWTKVAAKELGPKGIRVNAVAPGAVNITEAPRPDDLTKTFLELSALDALATPEDIAEAALFLASAKAKAITGAILDVNAGYRL